MYVCVCVHVYGFFLRLQIYVTVFMYTYLRNRTVETFSAKKKKIKKRLGGDCGSDHELLIVKFRLKLKKVGQTTRPFRYDLNQIPYHFTVEGIDRFKGLDLIYSA